MQERETATARKGHNNITVTMLWDVFHEEKKQQSARKQGETSPLRCIGRMNSIYQLRRFSRNGSDLNGRRSKS